MLVAGEGRRKVAEERGSAARSLYEVVRQFLVMEMEVFNSVVTMLVAERRGGEKERFYWQQKPSIGGWFFGCLLTRIFLSLEHANHIYLLVVDEGHFFYSSAKCQPLIRPESTPTIASKKQ